jgi:hypothetical protein
MAFRDAKLKKETQWVRMNGSLYEVPVKVEPDRPRSKSTGNEESDADSDDFSDSIKKDELSEQKFLVRRLPDESQTIRTDASETSGVDQSEMAGVNEAAVIALMRDMMPPIQSLSGLLPSFNPRNNEESCPLPRRCLRARLSTPSEHVEPQHTCIIQQDVAESSELVISPVTYSEQTLVTHRYFLLRIDFFVWEEYEGKWDENP